MSDNNQDRPTLEHLEELRKRVEGQSQLAMKAMVSGTHRSPLREKTEYEECTFYGATVVSVEGENFWQGSYQQRAVGFLGYWFGMEELIDSWRVYFTTPDGMRKVNKLPVKNQDFVLHPLCVNGDYIVPKHGGLQILDGGHLILVSRTGIFRGDGGYELAQMWQGRYREMYQSMQGKSQRVDELEQWVDSLQESKVETEVHRTAALEVMKEMQLKYGRAQTSYNMFLVEKDTLLALLRSMFRENDHNRKIMESTLANLAMQISDIMVFTETEAIEDSLRAHKSAYPKVLEEKKRRLREEWAEEDIVPEDEKGEELEQIKAVMVNQQKRIKELEKASKEEPPPPSQSPKSPPPPSEDIEPESRIRRGSRDGFKELSEERKRAESESEEGEEERPDETQEQ